MKMAVARPEEIEKAMVIAGILEDVDSNTFPRTAKGEWEESDPDHFDEDDLGHLQTFHERLMECGGLWRVALGYAVLTDPKNRIIDPDKSYLELHPRLLEGLRAVDHPFTYWPKRLWKGIWDILVEGWNL